MWRPLLILPGIAGSLIFTYFALRDIDGDVFLDSLRTSEPRWLVPAFLVLGAAVFLRALRWRLLFPRATRPPIAPVTRALLVGHLFDNLIPVRAGEAARVVVLHRETGSSRAEAVGTVVAERLYDVLSLLLLLFVATPFLPAVDWLRNAAILGAVVAILAVAVALTAGENPRVLRALLRPLARLPRLSSERLDAAATELARGLGGLRHPTLAIPAVAVTLASWLVMAVSFWLAMHAFELDLGYGAGVLVVVAVSLATVIPSLPAAIGVFEAATIVALRAHGVDDSHALPYAVVLHALVFFPAILIGYAALYAHSTRRRVDRVLRL